MIIRRDSKGPLALVRSGRHEQQAALDSMKRFRNIAGVSYATKQKSSLKHRKEGRKCEKTDSATNETDRHLSGARCISHGHERATECGKHIVGGNLRVGGELAGYAKVLLRACDAHGTRVPSMRRGERERTCLERTAFGFSQGVWCPTMVEGRSAKSSFSDIILVRLEDKGESVNTCLHGFRLVSGG